MNKAAAKKRATKLQETIDDLRHRYHVLDDPKVTDEVYDSLTKELRVLEEKFPELKTVHSPTQRIGGAALDKFEKVKHVVAQWSFNDAFTEQEIQDWDVRVKKMLSKKLNRDVADVEYVCELKIDGLHIVLTYENGILVSAATRGDGKVGENVTHNIKTIHSIPLKLKKPVDVIVEGEVWLPVHQLERINKERQSENKSLFANPRNAAAGAIRQLDPKVAAARKLDAFIYDISGGALQPETQNAELDLLGELGFKVNSDHKVFAKISDVIAFWKKWEPKRQSKEYWIDGVVVKVNQVEYQKELGFTGKAPRWSLAIKFAAEKATTVLKQVHWQVGRTGAVTPVATFEPVQVAGTTVTHATLHNSDEIKRLGVRIGDTVVIEKAGDIIPKVIEVIAKLRTGKENKIVEPKQCPMCNSALSRREGEVALYCINKKCFAQNAARLIHFAGKKGYDIEGLGEKIVIQLMEEGLVAEPADFFTLTVGDILPLERFAQKSAENLIEAIAAKKQISFARFINALGIRYVGEETAHLLAERFDSVEGLRNVTEQQLITIDGIGEKVAAGLVDYFASYDAVIDGLLAVGIIPFKEKVRLSKLTGKTIVFTGSLQTMTRDEAKEFARSRGAHIGDSVSSNTDYLVAGDKAGSKLKKAQKLGVKVYNEDEFLKIIKN